MAIPIEPEEEIFTNTAIHENCVFCDEATIYWNVKANRPVCVLCSVLNNESDIATAPHNY